jgi:hypothetical protein
MVDDQQTSMENSDLRVQSSGTSSVFQTENAGSIPIARSTCV